jgi:hypothetical protein
MTDLQRTIEALQLMGNWLRRLLKRVIARLNNRGARCLGAA